MIAGLTVFLLVIYLIQHDRPGVACLALAAMVIVFIWPGWWIPRR
jgi:hypothetical protein